MLTDEEIVVDIAAEETAALTENLKDKVDPMGSGFMWYVPPLQSSDNWVITGHDMQVLTTVVPAGGEVVTEVGSFMYMSPFMETEVDLTLCSKEGCNRICGGESCVKVFLRNNTGQQGYAGITPNYPAKVLPIKFGTHTSGDTIIAQSGSYMSHMGGDVDVGKFQCESVVRLPIQDAHAHYSAFQVALWIVVCRPAAALEWAVADRNSLVIKVALRFFRPPEPWSTRSSKPARL